MDVEIVDDEMPLPCCRVARNDGLHVGQEVRPGAGRPRISMEPRADRSPHPGLTENHGGLVATLDHDCPPLAADIVASESITSTER
jgi:hypothetical protein